MAGIEVEFQILNGKKMNRKPGDGEPAGLSRVAVLVETSTSWGRGIVSGINDYLRHQQHWQVLLEPRGPNSELRLPRQWRGEGIIARVASAGMARSLSALKIPVVNVSSIQLPGPSFPRVANDVKGVVNTAVEHFREKGFQHFGFFSTQKVHLQTEFESAVRAAGFDCHSYVLPPESGMEAGWNLSLNRLKAWLQSLPKPVAILAWGNGRPLIYAGQAAGLSTPEEVAVLTNYFDELVNELSPMPLSGIRIASERVGFEAAALLDNLLAGGKPPSEPLLIPPSGVVMRQSTSTLAIHDAPLARAVSYIREKAAEPIRVTDVARQAGLSRCVLERRFRETFNRSPGEEIRRVRIERARRLLIETDLSMTEVAERSGFGSNAYFTDCFNRVLGISPLHYRKQERKR